MNIHIHTLNKQAGHLDLQHGCLQPEKYKLLSEQGRALVQTYLNKGWSEQDIQTEITKKMKTLKGCNELVQNNLELVAERIGRTVTGRSVTSQGCTEPQLVLMQELTGNDREPLGKLLAQYGFRLVNLAIHGADDDLDVKLRYGNAVFLRDPDDRLEMVDTRALPINRVDIENSRFSKTEKKMLVKKVAGKNAAVCTLKLKERNVALVIGSIHLKGFGREQEKEEVLEQSRLPGARQHEMHLASVINYSRHMQNQHKLQIAGIVVGGDFNEDERFFQTRVCQKSGRHLPDENYRLNISTRYGFELPEDPRDQVPVKIISEQSEIVSPGEQIDFVTIRKGEGADCKLYMNYDAYREQIAEGIDNYPSDHILISTKLVID